MSSLEKLNPTNFNEVYNLSMKNISMLLFKQFQNTFLGISRQSQKVVNLTFFHFQLMHSVFKPIWSLLGPKVYYVLGLPQAKRLDKVMSAWVHGTKLHNTFLK